ncbi:sarcosine oxidase subunit delta [Acidiferrobacter thiooxydans]|uniref:Sarcosine oxidase subunit delta n=1 Tax=Acidiferrobacter thiooxydans TaxID=163359 RepID=A0A368HM88_9GAMM|nr:sarcosine oxidase subunit delta [Acidiferrobacter thiooxydans]MDA8120579.1 sarcosine oxidase subunit delta [Gammaproteobacteria bacterium]MDA8191023.1 sarcosine oxidase subunit delta [Gammaproteobacteria bacterium]RCN59257.1 sarcosine oxidase subunit delta [Acidiferrobacter thiooxydans]
MKTLTCPVNGPRPLSEFFYGGALRLMPDPSVDDALWADAVFNRAGIPGTRREWWCHIPSYTWFIAERDTATDVVTATYLFQGGAP